MKHGDQIRWNGHDGIIIDDPEMDLPCCRARPCGKVTVKVFYSNGGFTTAHVKPAVVMPRERNVPSRKTAHLH